MNLKQIMEAVSDATPGKRSNEGSSCAEATQSIRSAVCTCIWERWRRERRAPQSAHLLKNGIFEGRPVPHATQKERRPVSDEV